VQKVVKIARLGRTSFRTVKNNRDYLKNKQTSNWMYLSRLAAEKEYQFMTVLHNNGFSVPTPYDHSRHCILMEWIDGTLMKHYRDTSTYKKLYSDLMSFIVKLANHGLIHCDFNEFNIIIKNEGSPNFIVIDFPQCVSIEHPDAKAYFDRDVQGIRDFFEKKFKYTPQHDPTMFDTEGYGEGYKYAYPNFKRDVVRCASLDVEVMASGYAKKKTGSKEDKDLEKADDDEEEEEEEEEEYDDEDAFEEEESDSENEKIIAALSLGDKPLKMDKLGNYILDE
ncbi:uncharacterized protein SPAPADRAFT_59283, partial [Spathaspora passalidarum NRRL Y-27907]